MTGIGCQGRHEPNATPIPDHGHTLCHHCTTRLQRALADITTLWPLLTLMAQPGNGSSGTHGKPGSRPPCNLDVTDLTDPRGTIHQQITGWATLVIEQRQLAARPLDTEQAARLLTIHTDWITRQPWAADAAAEIGQCAWQIRRACHDLPAPPIGTCPDVDPTGNTDRCGGPLRIVTGNQYGTDTALGVVCARCGSRWNEADLPAILRVVEPTRRFPIPRAWVAVRYNVAPATLRQWIRRGHIRTYQDEQVDLFDVLTRIQQG